MTHEYPPNRAFDSVSISRVSALRDYGLTLRQREFLVTVMVHSGCFLERQYCEFTSTVRGQNSREFMARLVAHGFARTIEPGPIRRGRLYHVHHRPLYEAVGQADNRNRRLRTIGRMVERVMILDAVLGDRRCWWLSPESDKRAFFDVTQQTGLRPEDYPHIAFGAVPRKTIRCFPDNDVGRRSCRRGASRRNAGAHSDRRRVAGHSRPLAAMARRRTLPTSDVGAKLPEMIGAVIYVRVSTKEQTENLSLPTQLRAWEEYCRRHGFEILQRFHEQGESAKTTDRSELQNLLKYCRTHKGKVHFVIVYNLTRFAREKYDHFALRAHLKSLGISLRSATEPIDDTSTGKLMEGVLAAFAQFDNDVRSDRTRAGMRAALELGRWTFPAPLGYLNAPKWSGKSLVHDPDRAELIKRAFEDLATGRYTKHEVIARATAAGLRRRKGR